MSHESDGAGSVVVGIDGSPSSVAALRWALRHAEATGMAVEAVCAWQVPAVYGAAAVMLPAEDFAAAAAETLEATVEQVAVGDVPLTRSVVGGHPARVLVERAEDAELLVVGSRGHGGLVGTLVGSVSQYCVNHAACPVVVVRGH